MHCSFLLFCLEGTSFLVAFKLFRAEAKYFPLWVPQGQPCPSLAICFSVCSRHHSPCWCPPRPLKTISTTRPARANISSKNMLLLYNMCPHLTAPPGHWTENGLRSKCGYFFHQRPLISGLQNGELFAQWVTKEPLLNANKMLFQDSTKFEQCCVQIWQNQS